MSVKITLDLEFALPYARCFIPVQLGKANNSVRKFDLGTSLSLSPTSAAIAPPQPRELPNACASGDRLDIGDWSDNPEIHALTV